MLLYEKDSFCSFSKKIRRAYYIWRHYTVYLNYFFSFVDITFIWCLYYNLAYVAILSWQKSSIYSVMAAFKRGHQTALILYPVLYTDQ